MPVRVDEAGFEACSRVAGVAIADYTLRAAERWRTNVPDLEGAMIMLAVIAISAARLLRADDMPAAQRTLDEPIDRGLLTRVNIAGIAHATGLNRETARRKVNELIAAGELVRDKDGSISFPPGRAQSDRIREQARGQLAEICAIADQLERLGVLVWDRQA
jgi:hypothetical protein